MKKYFWRVSLSILILLILSFILLSYFRGCIGCRGLCDYSEELDVAVNQKNYSLCEFIETEPRIVKAYPNYDNYCREVCISRVALVEQNVSLCEQISNVKNISKVYGPTIKDSCYLNLAIKLRQSSLCNLSETSWVKEHCLVKEN